MIRKVTRRSGGIGRRAWFRSMYPQGCGGSSPFFGTSFFLNTAKNGMRFQIEQAALTAPPRRLDSQTQTSYGGLIGHQKQLSFAELAGIDSRFPLSAQRRNARILRGAEAPMRFGDPFLRSVLLFLILSTAPAWAQWNNDADQCAKQQNPDSAIAYCTSAINS